MRKIAFFIPVLILLTVSCNDKTNSIQADVKTAPFINQLFLHFNTDDASFCSHSSGNGSEDVFGAAYFTKNGNVIFNSVDQLGDTVRYFWGKYTVTDSTITYLLSDEFYYYGKWDARWDASEPDYKKGKTRKVQSKQVTIFKSKCLAKHFYQAFSKPEKEQYEKSHNGQASFGLIYMPYQETKGEKFYNWFYNQVPELANL